MITVKSIRERQSGMRSADKEAQGDLEETWAGKRQP